MKNEEIEKTDYEVTDAIIKTGYKTFSAVGKALIKMHDEKLYLKEFKTFEEYTASRGIKRRNAYNMMVAVKTSLQITDVQRDAHDSDPINKGDVEKTSGNALSELAKAPAEKQREIYQKANQKAGGPPTAKNIIEATAEVTHESKPKSAPKPPVIPPAMAIELPQPANPITLAECKAILILAESRINFDYTANQKQREQFGTLFHAVASRLLNPPVPKAYNPYA